MGFSRPTASEAQPPAEVLTARMVGIGMNFAAKGDPGADIESTLIHASVAGMDDDDLRVLSLLTTWLGVHHRYVNVDRLSRLMGAHRSERVRGYWAAVARWLHADRRLARLLRLHRGAPIDLLAVGTEFQIKRHGEDDRFAHSKLRVPRQALRDRAADVLVPAELVRRHPGYRNRVLMGPSWRADVWTVLERGRELSTAEVARQVSCSFATAWQAAQDFRLVATGHGR